MDGASTMQPLTEWTCEAVDVDRGERKTLHLNISAESAVALSAYCAGQGVTVTGLIDALGGMAQELPLAPVIERARSIDASRRAR